MGSGASKSPTRPAAPAAPAPAQLHERPSHTPRALTPTAPPQSEILWEASALPDEALLLQVSSLRVCSHSATPAADAAEDPIPEEVLRASLADASRPAADLPDDEALEAVLRASRESYDAEQRALAIQEREDLERAKHLSAIESLARPRFDISPHQQPQPATKGPPHQPSPHPQQAPTPSSQQRAPAPRQQGLDERGRTPPPPYESPLGRTVGDVASDIVRQQELMFGGKHAPDAQAAQELVFGGSRQVSDAESGARAPEMQESASSAPGNRGGSPNPFHHPPPDHHRQPVLPRSVIVVAPQPPLGAPIQLQKPQSSSPVPRHAAPDDGGLRPVSPPPTMSTAAPPADAARRSPPSSPPDAQPPLRVILPLEVSSGPILPDSPDNDPAPAPSENAPPARSGRIVRERAVAERGAGVSLPIIRPYK